MRHFEFGRVDRDMERAFHDAMRSGGFERTHQMNALGNFLEMRGVGYRREEGEVGPFKTHRLWFDSPHGEVSVLFAPGSIGSNKGLLEAYCDGWDSMPRGNMTAQQVVERYLHGGW